jgi:hypothetical protein
MRMATVGKDSLKIEISKLDDTTLLVRVAGPVIDNNVRARYGKIISKAESSFVNY